MAPQVRELNTLIAQQNESLKPQFGLIDEGIAANEASGAAQKAGLDATQVKAFKGIEQAAQNKKMFFSGFSPNEQAEYTASTYLPAVAALQQTIASARGQLLGDKAKLGKTAFDTAFSIQQEDKGVLDRWNEMTAQQQFQASQAEKDRAFQAAQNEANRRHEADIAAKNRAASAAAAAVKSAEKKGAPPGLTESIYNDMKSNVGKDGFASPGTYNVQKQRWIGAGGSPNSFNETFGNFVNPVHQQQFGGYF